MLLHLFVIIPLITWLVFVHSGGGPGGDDQSDAERPPEAEISGRWSWRELLHWLPDNAGRETWMIGCTCTILFVYTCML